MDNYLYFRMLKFLSIALVLIAVSGSAEPDRTMCHFKVSLEYPDEEPGSYKLFDKEVWMGDGGYLRIFEEIDLVLQIQLLLIKYPGASYMIDLFSGTGTLFRQNWELGELEKLKSYERSWPTDFESGSLTNQGGDELLVRTIAPVFHEREDALGAFKVGYELKFFEMLFDLVGKKKMPSKRIDKTTCDVWRIKVDDIEWTLYTNRFTKLPKLIVFKSDDYHYRLTYDVYECGLPFDSMLFVPPDNIAINDITDSVKQLMDSMKSAP